MLGVASLITSLLCRLAGRVVSTVRNIAKLRQESRRAGLAAAGERCNRRGIHFGQAKLSLNQR